MSDLRKAALTALLALEYHTQQTRPIAQTQEAIETLRAALDADAEQSKEPPLDDQSCALVDAIAQRMLQIFLDSPIKYPYTSTDKTPLEIFKERPDNEKTNG
jgi:hypothetical protein